METKKITQVQIFIAAIGLAIFILAISSTDTQIKTEIKSEKNAADFQDIVLPSGGIVLPIQWDDLGKQMVETGVIDKDKFEALYAQRGGLDEITKRLINNENNGEVSINMENSGVLLNLFWAFGLSNKNRILEEGPMMDEKYGGDASRFASTGGWSLSKGGAMKHYGKYSFVVLTEEEQNLVERVSKNIYRPCCGNSTYFPDCNHGMAMLGLLELLASNGLSENEMYKTALSVNSYWFPETYLTLAKYFNSRGVAWSEANPKEVLGSEYSSASGYMKILEEMEPADLQGGGGCGV